MQANRLQQRGSAPREGKGHAPFLPPTPRFDQTSPTTTLHVVAHHSSSILYSSLASSTQPNLPGRQAGKGNHEPRCWCLPEPAVSKPPSHLNSNTSVFFPPTHKCFFLVPPFGLFHVAWLLPWTISFLFLWRDYKGAGAPCWFGMHVCFSL